MRSIRMVRPSDLEGLVELARHASTGLTTLIPDAEPLRRRITESQAGEAPLLVMVQADDETILGTAGLLTRVGDARRAEPFYAYRIERSVHRCESLGVHHELDTLHLVKMFNGPTELGTLFLHPEYRGGGYGRVLSLSRFLLMCLHPRRFDRQVIAELRGVVDQDGNGPFWDALGRSFFQVEFAVADARSARDKRFIAELMPPHPIYVSLLPEAAQAVIGSVHPATAPARRLLESEGFHFANMVDIFDAGPCLRCDTAAVRTIRQSVRGRLAAVVGDPNPLPPDPPDLAGATHLVARMQGSFRLVACEAIVEPTGEVQLPRSAADALGIDVGDWVCVSPLRGEPSQFGADQPVLTEEMV